jgi:hypothetical protein
MFCHDCPLAVKPASTPLGLVHQKKKTWRDPLIFDMLLSAVSVLVVVQPSLKIPEGLMNYLILLQKTDSQQLLCGVCTAEARVGGVENQQTQTSFL